MNARLLMGLLLATAVTASAHRLDEYLQATRVAVSTNRIEVSLDLTPGVAVVGTVLAAIDTNHDAQLSERERKAYAEQVLKDIRLGVDGRDLTLALRETSFPTLPEMKAGQGVIRLKASVGIDPWQTGTHTLTFTNAHLPEISAYLVNALVPQDHAIQVTKQRRDELQKDYRLTFTVNAGRAARPAHRTSNSEPSP